MSSDDAAYVNPSQTRHSAWRLLEVAQISLSPGSIAIAMLAVVLLSSLGEPVEPVLIVEETMRSIERLPFAPISLERVNASGLPSVSGLETCTASVSRPWLGVWLPVARLLSAVAEGGQWRQLARFLAHVAIWALFGVVLCRRSALILTGSNEGLLIPAIRLGVRQWSTAVGAPLIPLGSALFLGLVIAVLGVSGRLPVLGTACLWLCSPIIVALSFAITFLLVATLLGWPLMVAAAATDDCDSFGALSRVYSGMTSRPWQLVGHWLIAAVLGICQMMLIDAFGRVVVQCAVSSVSWGSGTERALHSVEPPVRLLVGLILQGIGVCYFWSAATMIYLLLRYRVDGIPPHKLARDRVQRPVRDPLPVVGIPATDARSSADGKPSEPPVA